MTGLARITLLALVAACASSSSTRQVSYPNGTPHFEYELRDDLPHGTGRVWHPNGELSSEGPYVNGVKHGEFKFYDEDGGFLHKAFFWKNVEVWRSRSLSEPPPPQLIAGLEKLSAEPPRLGEGTFADAAAGPAFRISREPPAPYFAMLDRTTGLDRVGLQFGFGADDSQTFGSVTRLELFGNHRFSQFGAYGQVSQTTYEAVPAMPLTGRRTLEGGGTYHRQLASVGMLTARLGLLASIAHDDIDGFIASSAGAQQRPTDAATSFPSSVALRSGASLTRGSRRMILQADGGVDWLVGGPHASLDALMRLNGGVGFGVRSGLATLELSNTIRVTDPAERIHALGLGATFWLNRMWLATCFAATLDGTTSVTGSVGYEL